MSKGMVQDDNIPMPIYIFLKGKIAKRDVW
jgi:hypothetical protein